MTWLEYEQLINDLASQALLGVPIPELADIAAKKGARDRKKVKSDIRIAKSKKGQWTVRAPSHT